MTRKKVSLTLVRKSMTLKTPGPPTLHLWLLEYDSLSKPTFNKINRIFSSTEFAEKMEIE